MDDPTFHFAEPNWLWALVVPLLVWGWRRWRLQSVYHTRFQAYADPTLLPYLVHNCAPSSQSKRYWLRWLFCWCIGVLALAGPRWDYREVQLFTAGTDLLILLDLSASMRIEDVQPYRLARARQEIQDLLETSQGIRIGLVAFASFAHVALPVTEDHEALRQMLPFLDTQLIRWPGSRLDVALTQAERLWVRQDQAQTKHLLLISDGDFADSTPIQQIERLRAQGIFLHVIGIGTEQGGPVLDSQGKTLMDPQGNPVQSGLQQDQLRELARLGGGLYVQGDYRSTDTLQLIKAIGTQASTQEVREGKRIWEERYYILVAVMLLLCLPSFQRRA